MVLRTIAFSVQDKVEISFATVLFPVPWSPMKKWKLRHCQASAIKFRSSNPKRSIVSDPYLIRHPNLRYTSMAIKSAKFHVINHKNMDLNVFLEDEFYLLTITDSVTGIRLFLILLSSLKKRAVHYYDQAIYLRNNSAAPNPSSTTLEKKRIQNRTFFSSGNIKNKKYCDLWQSLSSEYVF